VSIPAPPAGYVGRLTLGIVARATDAAILAGDDRSPQTLLVQVSPGWLTDVTTRF
jgi:hypothetical protein